VPQDRHDEHDPADSRDHEERHGGRVVVLDQPGAEYGGAGDACERGG